MGAQNFAEGVPRVSQLLGDQWRRLQSDMAGVVRVVRAYPSIAIIPFLVLGLVLGVGVWGVTRVAQLAEISAKAQASSLAIDTAVWYRQQLMSASSSVLLMSAMAVHVRGQYRAVSQLFEGLAPALLSQRRDTITKMIEYVPNGVVRDIYPLTGNNGAAAGFNLFTSDDRDGAIQTVRDGSLTLVGPQQFFEGGLGVIVRMPVFVSGVEANETFGMPDALDPQLCGPPCAYNTSTRTAFWGFSAALIDLDAINSAADSKPHMLESMGYRFEISALGIAAADMRVVASSAVVPTDPVEAFIQLPNNQWVVRVAPEGGWKSPYYAGLLVGVIVLAVAVAVLLFAALFSRRRNKMLLEALLPKQIIRDLHSDQHSLQGSRILNAETTADMLLGMLSQLLMNQIPSLRDVVYCRQAIIRHQPIYEPIALGQHIRNANLDRDVARNLMHLMGRTDSSDSLYDTSDEPMCSTTSEGGTQSGAAADARGSGPLGGVTSRRGLASAKRASTQCHKGHGLQHPSPTWVSAPLQPGSLDRQRHQQHNAEYDTLTGALSLILTPAPAVWADCADIAPASGDIPSDAAAVTRDTEMVSTSPRHSGQSMLVRAVSYFRELSSTVHTPNSATRQAQAAISRGGSIGHPPGAGPVQQGAQGAMQSLLQGQGQPRSPSLFRRRSTNTAAQDPAPGTASLPGEASIRAGALGMQQARQLQWEQALDEDPMARGSPVLASKGPFLPPAPALPALPSQSKSAVLCDEDTVEARGASVTDAPPDTRRPPRRVVSAISFLGRRRSMAAESPLGNGPGGLPTVSIGMGTSSSTGAGMVSAQPAATRRRASTTVIGEERAMSPGALTGTGTSRRSLLAGSNLAAAISARTQSLPPPPPVVEEVERQLAKADSLQFNTWLLREATGGFPLAALGFYLIHRAGLVTQFDLKPVVLARALRHIEAGYIDNPYHSATHAADVLQTLHVIIHGAQLQVNYLDPLGLFAAYWAAIVHDYRHPGLTNDFLIATDHPLAVRYNDRSPLENHHAASSFATLRRPELDMLAPLAPEERVAFKKQVIDMVLATDMKQHFSLISQFNAVHSLASFVHGQPAGEAGTRGSLPSQLNQRGSMPRLPTSGATARQHTVRLHHDGDTRSPRTLRTQQSGSAAALNDILVTIDGTGVNGLDTVLMQQLSEGAPHPIDDTERLLSLQMIMKAADLGHLGEELEVHMQWLAGLEEEFFRQGDREKALGLPISPLFDRAKQGVSKSQVGFYDFVALPLVHALSSAFPGAQPLMKCFLSNYSHWKTVETMNV